MTFTYGGGFLPDTIAAIATGNAVSAIGIVRVSGENALTASDSIFRATCGLNVLDFEDRRMYYGELVGQRCCRGDGSPDNLC